MSLGQTSLCISLSLNALSQNVTCRACFDTNSRLFLIFRIPVTYDECLASFLSSISVSQFHVQLFLHVGKATSLSVCNSIVDTRYTTKMLVMAMKIQRFVKIFQCLCVVLLTISPFTQNISFSRHRQRPARRQRVPPL